MNLTGGSIMINKTDKNYLVSAGIAILITFFIIVFSEEAFIAALEGLKIWWEVVFPSLLPFFIIAEILMGLGVVHFMGALLEPLMRPLFRVPGVGAFAMAMGLASGYPIGAKITANLRRKKLCNKTEGERLVSFTNTADPLFMIGAVAVGFFHRVELGIIIAGAHYISSLITGLLLRFYKGNELPSEQKYTHKKTINRNLFIYAINELIEARKNDGRSIGELLGDSIKESINTLFMVGGFIILFSVITEILIVTGVINALSQVIGIIIQPFGLPNTLILPLVSGFFEITNGANLTSQSLAPLIHQIIIINSIIAWSGLSVHAQVATMINDTDISLKPYFFSRILQSILAAITTIFLFKYFYQGSHSVFLPYLQNFNTLNLNAFILISIVSLSILIASLLISILIHFIQKIRIIFFYYN